MSNIIDVLQAKDEIHELIARYCHTLDFGFYEEWVDCFTEDGAFDSPIFGRHPGKVALRKLTESYKIWGGDAKHRHCVMNINLNVDVDKGCATGEAYWLFAQVAKGKTELILSGRYVDKIEKVNGRWLFKEVKVHPDSQPAKDELGGHK